MPISLDQKISDNSQLLLWSIEEDEIYFTNRLQLSPNEHQLLEKLTAKHRRLEWLTIRLLIQTVFKKHIEITYNYFGRPILQNQDVNISISHSKNLAGIYIHQNKQVGLDIEFISNKVEKVKHKFMSSEEIKQLKSGYSIKELIIYWCAKECLLKIFGRKDIDFKNDLNIKPFSHQETGVFSAEIRINQRPTLHSFRYFTHNDYMVVFGQ